MKAVCTTVVGERWFGNIGDIGGARDSVNPTVHRCVENAAKAVNKPVVRNSLHNELVWGGDGRGWDKRVQSAVNRTVRRVLLGSSSC